ncbi:hypothetical protein SDC9_183765 [bioreactor metagenome]|uniref:Uncharacterized protein n=1 Tax=bioreactor metagenome TaxID=1076179 RepID=A0A645HCL0_9ZZZZ
MKRRAARFFVRLDDERADIQRGYHWNVIRQHADGPRDGIHADVDRRAVIELPLRRQHHQLKRLGHTKSSPKWYGCKLVGYETAYAF